MHPVLIGVSIRFVAVLLTAFMLMSCDASLEDRLSELVVAKETWVAQAGARPYAYQLQAGANAPFNVSVTEPGLLRDDWMENPPCFQSGACRIDPTMRELFQLVLDLTGEQFENGGKLEVDYDEVLGYPTRIFRDDRSGPHSAIEITVSDLEFLAE